MRRALITGLAGYTLTVAEQGFLKSTRPAGIILFARNCANPEQISALVQASQAAVGTERLLVLIDQEGGRVRRLRPPLWRELPAARVYAELYARDPEAARTAARLVARLTASDLRAIGINTNCAPVLDVEIAGAHDTPMSVSTMASATPRMMPASNVPLMLPRPAITTTQNVRPM